MKKILTIKLIFHFQEIRKNYLLILKDVGEHMKKLEQKE